ncbi:IS3 family transposase [Acidiferrimicrobium sp. IK]|uniref:IS3 family transposase n=1 Tax=Acidiferrimicrobium sp. IK TaxID=2871700 RepID=UPI0021CB101A|nr:IS3 family transposase [Acidiferrimicrobium sp. IK]MCU4187479.1 IS3 family transposase [Acidiferrimicrobium sp. IK]
MSLAGFIADQRTFHRVPHAVSCRALDVSESWFYKWRDRPPTERDGRRALLDAAAAAAFRTSGGTYGSPRIYDDLVEEGWKVSVNTIAESMVRQGLVARAKKRRKNLTRPDKQKRPFPDLVRRDVTG